MITIITTRDWGARVVDNSRLDRMPAEAITIHHTAGANINPGRFAFLERWRCIRLARAIQRDHISQGWSDSGHHFLVTRSGLVLEGRQGTLASAKLGMVVQGAHAGRVKVNQTQWGIECEGTYTSGLMPDKQWDALVNLCAHLCFWGNVQSQALSGHRDHKATQCPGDWLYAKLPDLRLDVRDRKLELMNQ